MTARDLAAEAMLRTSRVISRTISRITDDPQASYVSDHELTRSLGDHSLAEVSARIREFRGPSLTLGLADLPSTAAAIRASFPDSIEGSRNQADAILAHRIQVFGNVCDLGGSIDWHRDPWSGARWPQTHYSRMPLTLGHGGDVRVVWELNRLQHFITLGRAYALTGDERYTDEFLTQLTSWNEANPPRFGPNWMNAMEAAIRAVNLIAGLEMFSGSPRLTDEAIGLVLKTLIAHGNFISSNLEFTHRLASNHFLSDLIGLFAIGMTTPELEQSGEWISSSAARLLVEMDRQVLADGVDYEGSIAYHRFVVEIFALFFSMNRAAGIEIPKRYWERLETMFDFVRGYLKPDGAAPRIGDSDDGRVLKFTSRPPDDHSYLMPIAAVLTGNNKFKLSGESDEELLWWFGTYGREVFDRLPVNEAPPQSQAFPDARIFIQRHEHLYSIIDCGDHGALGRGSHAHSDALSIEVFAHGRTFIRDPGTFAYTGSERWRNRFRSTAYHNTVRVDGEEISRIVPGALFILGSNVRPRVHLWESNNARDVLDAEHAGYARLPQPVIHRRVVLFDKRDGYWILRDILSGEGRHRFEFFFNLDAGLKIEMERDRIIAHDGVSALAIVPRSGHAFEVKRVARWVSPSYGTRLRSSAIMFRLDANAPFENIMQLIPYRLGDEERARRISLTSNL